MFTMGVIQMLLLCAELSLAYKVPARFLRDPGEMYGVKYEMPKQFIVKELLDSKSSLLSSEETTLDDSPDTEEGIFEESYYVTSRHKSLNSNAAEENFEDYPGPVITLPKRGSYDDLFRKKRSNDDDYYWYLSLDQDHLYMGPKHLNLELEEGNTLSIEPQDATMSSLGDEATTQEPSQETSSSEILESSAVEDVTTSYESQPQDAVTPETPSENTSETSIPAPEDVSSTTQGQEETPTDQGVSQEIATEQGVSQETFTEQGLSQETNAQEGFTSEVMQDTTTTISPNIYTAPPFDLLDFIGRFDTPSKTVESSFNLFNLPLPSDY